MFRFLDRENRFASSYSSRKHCQPLCLKVQEWTFRSAPPPPWVFLCVVVCGAKPRGLTERGGEILSRNNETCNVIMNYNTPIHHESIQRQIEPRWAAIFKVINWKHWLTSHLCDSCNQTLLHKRALCDAKPSRGRGLGVGWGEDGRCESSARSHWQTLAEGCRVLCCLLA